MGIVFATMSHGIYSWTSHIIQVLVAKQKKHSQQATLKEKRSKLREKPELWTCHMALSGPVSLNEKTKRRKRAKTPKVSEFGAECSGNKKLENFPSIGRFPSLPLSQAFQTRLNSGFYVRSTPYRYPPFSPHILCTLYQMCIYPTRVAIIVAHLDSTSISSYSSKVRGSPEP